MRFRNLIFVFTGVAVAMLFGLIWAARQNNKPESEVSVERLLDGNSLALAWTFDAGGPINSSPLRTGEVVLVAPSGGPLMALNVETGAQRWQYSPPEGVWDRAIAADGRRVFVGLGGGRLTALEAGAGKMLWQKDLGIDVQYPPLVDDGVLYVPTTFVGPGLEGDASGRAKLFALAADDGRGGVAVSTVGWSSA
ncbi:MAG: PQQ-binding-like beta-propeller repeat protein, partial [Chloroflexota bacterium]